LAFAAAIAAAAPQDVVLIAGKGHEDYQEIAGQRIPFSDVAVAVEALAAWKQ
jgi:UDP-N-acetylmuramoyl-L-alanyl-D-glutamate--2,6-diaminopimelate ligase